MDGATFWKTPISCSAIDKNPMSGHLFEGNPVDEGTTRRGTDSLMHLTEKTEDSTHSSTNGLLSCEQLERQAEFHSSTQDEAWLSCPNSSGTLWSEFEMERNP